MITDLVSVATVRRWMWRHYEEYVDECGDLNATAMVEAAAREFGFDETDGPLDDPDHYVWELPLLLEQARK